MNTAELVQEYFRRTGTHRTDLDALAEFAEARDSDGSADSLKLIKLFWHTFRPGVVSTDSAGLMSGADEEPQPLPDDLETAFLEQLADLERGCRIPYVSDSDDLSEFSTLGQYIYVGGASVLRHRRRDGFSEYVRDTLDMVWRLLRVIERQGYIDFGLPLLQEKLSPGETASLYGTAGLVLTEIFHIRNLDGDYGGALSVAADVLWSLGFVEEALPPSRPVSIRELAAVISGEASGSTDDAIDEEDEKRYQIELEIYETVMASCPLRCLTPQQIVNSFEGLRASSKSEDWKKTAELCKEFVSNLKYSEDKSLLSEPVTGADGREEPWILFWRGAEVWAAEQLGPNELRDFLRQQERDASQKRLVSYFFGETWGNIPEKVQEHLIDAESSWFNDRGGAISSVLNHLRLATETMCYILIWELLEQVEGEQGLPDFTEFKNRDPNLSKGFYPTLSTYVRVYGQRFFKEFVKGTGLSKEDQDFLTSDEMSSLGSALNYLQRNRNPAEHDPHKRMTRDEVRLFVNLFFGIGKPGVLRRLAEIGPKLAAK